MSTSQNIKSNHMMQYYRKQSDRKMIQTIINMKSQFHHHFTESIEKQHQKNKRNNNHQNVSKHHQTSITNKKKKNQLQTLQTQQIHIQNQRIVLRLQRARQQSSRDYQKYFDFTISQRLLKTRNVFRKRAKDETKNKIDNENNMLMKRLLDTRSSYSLKGSKKRLNKLEKECQKLTIYCQQDKSTRRKHTLQADHLQLDNDELGLIKKRNSKTRVKTESIPISIRLPKSKLFSKREVSNEKEIALKNCAQWPLRYTETINTDNQDQRILPGLRVRQNPRKESKSSLTRYHGL